MNNELINPFLIYWDIDRSSDISTVLNVCEGLISAKIFVLNLRDSSPMCEGTIAVIKRFRQESVRIVVTVSGGHLSEADMVLLKGQRLKCIYIEVDSVNHLKSAVKIIEQLSQPGHGAGISIELRKDNFMEIPAIIRTCIQKNINNIEFPIPRADGGEIFNPGSDDGTRLRKEIEGIELDKVNLSIHDPFLWELFKKTGNPNKGGCNGAKTMAYIAANLDVTPCPLLPVVMGSLVSTDINDIFLSEKRRNIRDSLSAPPLECNKCDVCDKCLGGCRGRAYVLYGSLDKRDPACPLDN